MNNSEIIIYCVIEPRSELFVKCFTNRSVLANELFLPLFTRWFRKVVT